MRCTHALSALSRSFVLRPAPTSFSGASVVNLKHPTAANNFAKLLTWTSLPVAAARESSSSITSTMDLSNAALLAQVQALIPSLDPEKYKGQAGKVAVIGGCREYTGAPYFAAYSALKVGADLSHVFCTSGAATVIKTYSPELIVHPYLAEVATNIPRSDADPAECGSLLQDAITAVIPWLERFDVLVVGPGLGRDPLILEIVKHLFEEARQRKIPLVIDADGLWLLNTQPHLVVGYPMAVLTPNAAEFRRLCATFQVQETAEDALQQLSSKLNGPIVVKKGSTDVISNGKVTLQCSETGSLRRAGGQGDVLSGTIAAFVAWSKLESKEKVVEGSVPRLMVAAYGGCLTTRLASRRAFEKHGRAMGATDVIEELGKTIDDELDAPPLQKM